VTFLLFRCSSGGDIWGGFGGWVLEYGSQLIEILRLKSGAILIFQYNTSSRRRNTDVGIENNMAPR